jgi:hypothetical protein
MTQSGGFWARNCTSLPSGGGKHLRRWLIREIQTAKPPGVTAAQVRLAKINTVHEWRNPLVTGTDSVMAAFSSGRSG